METHYRQGDILLIRVAKAPRNAKNVNRENGKLILAHGEVTGHHHAFDVDVTNVELVTAEQANELFLMVHGTAPAPLTHQEHATIDIEPGVYEVRRQREYSPAGLVNVSD